MSGLVFVNVSSWVPEQVADWLRGVEEFCEQFLPQFLLRGVNGKQLLCLSHTDLEKCGVTKVGHQETIMEALECLVHLHHELDSQTLQSLALQLSCLATYLKNEVQVAYNNIRDIGVSVTPDSGHFKIPLTVMTCISNTVKIAKEISTWLDKPPFHGSDEYTKIRNELMRLSIGLITTIQCDDLRYCAENLMTMCTAMTAQCNKIVRDSQDPLVLQSRSLEIVTIRKKPEEELGMNIHSLYIGRHYIERIKENSPCDICGKVDEGDEVVQVNYQTIIGWCLKSLVNALKENQKEVTLTLAKRPRHANPLGGNAHRNKKKAKNLQQSTFPKALSRRSRDSEKGARAPLKDFLNAIPPSPSESLSESCHEISVDSSLLESGDTNDPDEEEEVFQGTSNTLDYSIDPKQRRATVSGGSPTLTRPSIIVDDFELTPVNVRPKSHTISSPSSDDTHSTTSTSEGQASPELDMRNKTGGRDVGLPNLSPSPDRRGELRLHEYRAPLTATKSCGSPSGKRRSTGVIATDQDKGSPSLVRVRRLDSKARADLEREKNSPEGISPNTSGTSYTVNVVGGVIQRIPSSPGSGNAPSKDQDPGAQSPTSLLRHSRIMRKMGTHRRISCKDLGHGDCQGWLWKKKDTAAGVLGNKWAKRWFVMKRQNLYYYRTPEDSHADGVLYLPGFKISPAPEIKSKKFAFKAHHSGTTFFFAAERQDDMGKWMNKLGLAAITYDTSGMRTTAGFYRPDSPPHQVLLNNAGYYSESDEDNSESSTPSSPATPRATTPRATTPVRGITLRSSPSPLRNTPEGSEGDHLAKVYSSIRRANLALDGSSVKQKRTSTMAPADRLHIDNSKELMFSRKLASLQRTLRAKQKELESLELILKKPNSLLSIQTHHPDILEHLYGDHAASSTQSEEEYSC